MSVCERCEQCFNYRVCENGCFGSTEPCEYYHGDDEDEENPFPERYPEKMR